MPPTPTLPPRSPLRAHPLNLAQTAYLAHTTRRKLSTAASRADHDLRVLVGHANFLDSLLLELAEAHKDQECQPPPSPMVESFARQGVEEPRRRADVAGGAVSEKPVDDWEVWDSESDGSESDGSDSDSGDDRGENDGAVTSSKSWVMGPGLARAGKLAVVAREVGEDEDDDGDDYGDLALVRTLSYSHSPPRFLDDPFA